jgi:hypothetical protein
MKAITTLLYRKGKRERKPSWDDDLFTSSSRSAAGLGDNNNGIQSDDNHHPLRQRGTTLRYVNYNANHNHCSSLDRVLDAARESGKPILAHFVATPSGTPECQRVVEIFADPMIQQVIEECFIPAVFFNPYQNNNNNNHHNAPHGRILQKWIRASTPCPGKDCLRIVTHDGPNVIGWSDDVVTDQFILVGILRQALQTLHRHVPECWHRNSSSIGPRTNGSRFG